MIAGNPKTGHTTAKIALALLLVMFLVRADLMAQTNRAAEGAAPSSLYHG